MGICMVCGRLLSAILLGVQGNIAGRFFEKGDTSKGQDFFSKALNLLSLLTGIALITIEILRANSSWVEMSVSIFWAISALSLILFGMKQKRAPHRYFGLALFELTTSKVVLVDSSELTRLERIATFIATGILLLTLSFAYQKVSSYFLSSD